LSPMSLFWGSASILQRSTRRARLD
jgi:hypothetical protein